VSTDDLGLLLPDDLMAALKAQYGEVQTAAYVSLARARGVSVRAVLAAAVRDDLVSIVRSEA